MILKGRKGGGLKLAPEPAVRMIHRESFTAEEAFATLVNFETFIRQTYILAARVGDGQAVVLNPLPGALIDAWQAALKGASDAG